jgi:hypothetical protein
VQAEVWVDDPNAFVADEDDEADAYSLRTAGFDLLGVGHILQSVPICSAYT